MSEDAGLSSATEVRDLIRARKLSVVEAVTASLRRVEDFNPTINAIVTLNPRTMDDARALDARLAKGEDPGPLCA